VKVAAACALSLLALSGCRGNGGEPTLTTGTVAEGLVFTDASAVHDGDAVPTRFTCDGVDVSPALEWNGVPDGTKELAIVVEDPDAPAGSFTHWLVWHIDPAATTLSGDAPVREGTNDFGKLGYGGPCPPRGQTHHYVFRLLALDEAVDLDAGSDRSAFDAAVGSHVVAEARLTASYARP
jgi:Raf kinase inhibitor-like YbhB/YbcL family protein